jgi:hypothetical protein
VYKITYIQYEKFIFTCGKLSEKSINFTKNALNIAVIVENPVGFVDYLR